ncbi:SET and MYND domain-containing protein 4-like [Adelges cooleyi]|uniref:SET and MYND domain-containing protein 4-like n=1 Tax=Adelges cooleyi TaxID=133065 RepID=UPI00218015FE|nr:SET and MYND domain-containing protein 4-like [Adelges cooleyi]
MFVKWDELMDIITDYSVQNKLLEKFCDTAHDKKVNFCMSNTFIRSCIDRWLDSPEFDNSLKNVNKSKHIRVEGNKILKLNDYEKCFNLYTQAAQYALPDSLEYALSLSNRSVVCFKLNKFYDCLKDIEMTLDILNLINSSFKDNEKDILVVKLLKRKIQSLLALCHYTNAYTCWQELSKMSPNIYKKFLDDELIQRCNDLPKYFIKNEEKHKSPKPKILTENSIQTILKTNNVTLPFKSSKLELCCSETKGRHFIASTKINYGELLIFEKPVTFVLLSEYYESFCYNCCSALKYHSIPCKGCSSILYCSIECREKSWELYHCWECKQGASIFKCIGIAHLALRLTLETCQNTNNEAVNNLLTHINDFNSLELYQYCLTATLLLLFLEKKTDFFSKNPKLTSSLVGSELLHHMTRLVCNGNAISTYIESRDISTPMSPLIEESESRIGTAIFPTSSMLNHSCDPNIFSSNILNFVVIKASRDIKKGEEVTNCYGPNFRRMRFSERQAALKMQYYFDCKCNICMDPVKDNAFHHQFNRLVCLSCKNEMRETIFDLETKQIILCDHCSKSFKSLQYSQHLAKVDETYNKALKEFESDYFSIKYFPKEDCTKKVIGSLLECLTFYKLVLNHKNSYILKCQDNIAKCLAMIADYSKSLEHLNSTFITIEQRYGENSLEVAYELKKITDIMSENIDSECYNNKSSIKKALKYIKRAMNIFHALLSAWDIPYNEPVRSMQAKYDNLSSWL